VGGADAACVRDRCPRVPEVSRRAADPRRGSRLPASGVDSGQGVRG
jgi:hypothetical protein